MTTVLHVPVKSDDRPSRSARYMLLGGALGLIVAIVATFAMALFDGHAQGMSAGNCVLYGCVLTLLLSQVSGISGMIAGAGAGALVGGIASLIVDRARGR